MSEASVSERPRGRGLGWVPRFPLAVGAGRPSHARRISLLAGPRRGPGVRREPLHKWPRRSGFSFVRLEPERQCGAGRSLVVGGVWLGWGAVRLY